MTINDQKPSSKRFAVHKQDYGGTRLHISAGGFLLYVLCIRPRDQSGGSECVCVGRGFPLWRDLLDHSRSADGLRYQQTKVRPNRGEFPNWIEGGQFIRNGDLRQLLNDYR